MYMGFSCIDEKLLARCQREQMRTRTRGSGQVRTENHKQITKISRSVLVPTELGMPDVGSFLAASLVARKPVMQRAGTELFDDRR